ncbi:MFS transporter [Aspergillus clavatus NRRL 1]|uniref:MFS transporter, putative n=1 Tax=Aspergillus clavatus (strain ATCC 1007 / CBS 513.65 / DSM 816 / NCTC 3887 / NRRL 1 / QM 1276 / 107) TaxID=344612 RepID=A1CBZ7_ASPCL|nr:MFS transporter, putative [Aspergillus clavatus NRRL 1]EAW13265.1 MFS transporter, putative [Aspergillus clavatus NRRL 1]
MRDAMTPSELEKGGESEATLYTTSSTSSEDPKQQDEAAQEDPNLVTWDGPDDITNPFNWPTKIKMRQLVLMAVNTFITPLASSMFAPGVALVMREFHSADTMLASFVVSVFVLGYVVGPFLIAPLSEMYGRVPLYHACNILFLIFTIACAVAQSLPQLIVFRLLAGIAGVCPLTIGSGTVADMIPKEKRAGIMAIWALGPILGPVIGPVAGGFLAEAEGWRWVFWVIAIATGVVTIACMLAYRESYAPVLLRRKAARLRKETNNANLYSIHDSTRPTQATFLSALARPGKLLTRSPIVFLMSLFSAVTYGYLYLMFTTITSIFETHYHFSPGVAGLAFLGFGIGCVIGLVVCGAVANHIAAVHSARGCFTPESRLPPMLVGCWFIPVGLFWYGWAAEAGTHWIVPILGTGVFAIGLMAVFMSANTYLVDSYLAHAASVTAASTALRSLVGAVLPLAGPAMYDALGLGWGNSLLAFIALAMCVCPILFWKFGARIRTHPRFQVQL